MTRLKLRMSETPHVVSYNFFLRPWPSAVKIPRVLKWIKFFVAILLLPVCAGAAMALWKVLCASGSADMVWVPLLAGAACWLVIFLLLPKPMWIYVFGHELTHAVWTWLFGGQLKKLKVSSSGGHVVVSKIRSGQDQPPRRPSGTRRRRSQRNSRAMSCASKH